MQVARLIKTKVPLAPDLNRSDVNQGAVDPQAATRNEPVEPTAQTFWDLRDRLESRNAELSLRPISVAPYLWRKITLRVLHGEIEVLDEKSSATRSAIPTKAMRDLELLNVATRQQESPTRLRDQSGNDVNNDIQQLYQQWRLASASQLRKRVDTQVESADALQFAITVARTRWWGLRLYQQQAIANACDMLPESTGWASTLNRAESLLLNQTGTVVEKARMQKETEQLWSVIREFDRTIEKEIDDLIDTFGRARNGDGHAWREIRQAYVWLRTFLPTGEQRRRLADAFQGVVIKPSGHDQSVELATMTFADTKPSQSGTRLARIKSLTEQQNLLDGKDSAWSDMAKELMHDDFATSFSAALRVDPRDASSETRRTPILNLVAAIPREPNPTSQLLDSGGNLLLEGGLGLESLNDHLLVEISPDSESPSQFEISFEIRDSVLDQPPVALRWQIGPGVERTNDPSKILLNVPAGERQTRSVQLDVRASRYADESVSSVNATIVVEPKSGQGDDHVRKLRRERLVRIGLPQQDQVLVVARTEGLTKESFSGDEFADGIWLRTFASRLTNFDLSLLNDSGRACRAQVWLLSLRHPFLRERVIEYWPDLIASRLESLRSQLLDTNGRVFENMLQGGQRLKGPATVSLAAGRAETKLTWRTADSDPTASGESATVPGADAAPADGVDDVTHGMALVVRLIDDQDTPLPGGDQLVWLIPKPWSPERYVRIEDRDIEYDRGEVRIAASLKEEIDGDNQPDKVPDIVRRAVSVRWEEDSQWEGFRPSMTRGLDSQTMQLSELRGDDLVVPVDANRGESSIRLDVDGWPRAIPPDRCTRQQG